MLNEQEKRDAVDLFMLWLTKNGMILRFQDEMSSQRGVNGRGEYLNEMDNYFNAPSVTMNNVLRKMLNMSMTWSMAKRGFDYWDDMDSKLCADSVGYMESYNRRKSVDGAKVYGMPTA
jgi:hypothetical protein